MTKKYLYGLITALGQRVTVLEKENKRLKEECAENQELVLKLKKAYETDETKTGEQLIDEWFNGDTNN